MKSQHGRKSNAYKGFCKCGDTANWQRKAGRGYAVICDNCLPSDFEHLLEEKVTIGAKSAHTGIKGIVESHKNEDGKIYTVTPDGLTWIEPVLRNDDYYVGTQQGLCKVTSLLNDMVFLTVPA